MSNPPRVALTIAGSDCCGGAGLQADLKTFHHFGVHGLSAATCVVAETPNEVRSIHAIPPIILQDQIEILLESYPVAAIKTGMLYSKPHVVAVSEILARHPGIPLVVDPVMIASTGDPLLERDAIEAYRSRLLPLARLITPNLDEAAELDGRPLGSAADIEAAAARLAAAFGTAVLLKGGHLPGPECGDYLLDENGGQWFRSPRIETTAGHGTGCTLSAAVTAGLANGRPLAEAVGEAKTYLDHALAHSLRWGRIAMLNQGLGTTGPGK
jgi:hydroxymethylpyrimidine/phosphomethylpyrimidine kinase